MGRFWAALANGLFGGFQRAATGGAADPLVEFSPDPGFDTAGVWTITPTADVNSTSASMLHFGSRFGIATGVAAHTLVPGTYRVTGTVANLPGSGTIPNYPTVTIGGTTYNGNVSNPASISANGPITFDLVVASITDQNIAIAYGGTGARKLYDLADCTVRRIA